MAIVQDIRRASNAQGRVATSFKDDVFTRYVEIIRGEIVVCDSDLDAFGQPVERHRNRDLVGLEFQPTGLSTTRSGFDGKLIVTVAGFTPGTSDSRRITVKTELVIAPPA